MKAAAGQALIDAAGGFATTAQLLTVISRKQLDRQIRQGQLVRVWRGVYGIENPDSLGRLRALDLFLGREAVACLGTAAQLHGFDTENPSAIHILIRESGCDPPSG